MQGEDAVRAAGRQIHGRLADGSVCVTQKELHAKRSSQSEHTKKEGSVGLMQRLGTHYHVSCVHEPGNAVQAMTELKSCP